MEPQDKQSITVSFELFNKMFGILTNLPFKDVNALMVEIQQEMQQNEVVAKNEEK